MQSVPSMHNKKKDFVLDSEPPSQVSDNMIESTWIFIVQINKNDEKNQAQVVNSGNTRIISADDYKYSKSSRSIQDGNALDVQRFYYSK